MLINVASMKLVHYPFSPVYPPCALSPSHLSSGISPPLVSPDCSLLSHPFSLALTFGYLLSTLLCSTRWPPGQHPDPCKSSSHTRTRAGVVAPRKQTYDIVRLTYAIRPSYIDIQYRKRRTISYTICTHDVVRTRRAYFWTNNIVYDVLSLCDTISYV